MLNINGVFTPSGFINTHPLHVTRFAIDREVPTVAGRFGIPVPHRIEPIANIKVNK